MHIDEINLEESA